MNFFKAESDPQSGMERYWLCSNKFALFIEDNIPLWTEHYDGRLSIQAQIRDSLYANFFVRFIFLFFFQSYSPSS